MTISVFEASTSLEAHMILDQLNQAGITAHIEGEHLQGAIGGLQAIDVVRVMVNESDYDQAKLIVSEWDAKKPEKEQSTKPTRHSSGALFGFFAGLLTGAGITIWVYVSPISENGIDYNGDGLFEEKWFYRGEIPAYSEIDRNRDGKTDLIQKYDTKGIANYSESDDNFDGFFETLTKFKEGNTIYLESDLNRDGKPDYKMYFKNGVLDAAEILDPNSGKVRKSQKFVMGKLASAEYDSNGDGSLDIAYEYDEYEELISQTEIAKKKNN